MLHQACQPQWQLDSSFPLEAREDLGSATSKIPNMVSRITSLTKGKKPMISGHQEGPQVPRGFPTALVPGIQRMIEGGFYSPPQDDSTTQILKS